MTKFEVHLSKHEIMYLVEKLYFLSETDPTLDAILDEFKNASESRTLSKIETAQSDADKWYEKWLNAKSTIDFRDKEIAALKMKLADINTIKGI